MTLRLRNPHIITKTLIPIVSIYVCVSVGFITSLIPGVSSYKVKPINPSKLGNHQYIASKAVEVLRRANLVDEADFFAEPYLKELMQGAYDADMDGGHFKALWKSVDNKR